MMQLKWITVSTFLVMAVGSQQQTAFSQQTTPQAGSGQDQLQQAPLSGTQNARAVAGQQVRQAGAPAENGGQGVQPVAANRPPQAPFQLTPAEAENLKVLLAKWETVSQATKTLECTFQRWHYDMFAAPAGIHATKSVGVVKYAAPDKGLFRVDQLVFYKGMQTGKPQYGPQQGKFGEHWVCNGTQLIEFDRTLKQCRVQELPPGMQGKQIFNSPLPFVFNLDAEQITQRYWVRERNAPTPGIYLIEAFPKRQEDRAQYKLVQIALDQETFLPKALIMYAPNFDVKVAQKYDHYEFTEMKRNSIGSRIQNFMNYFVPQKPPADWQIVHSKIPDTVQQAAAPNGTNRK